MTSLAQSRRRSSRLASAVRDTLTGNIRAYPRSILIVDFKVELAELFSATRRRVRKRPYCFNPWPSKSINPLDILAASSRTFVADAKTVMAEMGLSGDLP